MKLSIICFSLTGLETAIRLKTEFEKQGHRVLLASKSKYLKDSIQESVLKWTESRFSADDGILFVGACGIAVRSIAPYVASKKSDPAVLVIDECGKFVISLLSGHLGGANELALTASEILNAQAVVTTATDLHERFAVDIFAKKNGCDIMNMTAAKEVSAAVLAGEKVGFYSEFPWTGTLPQGLILCDRKGVPVSPDEKNRTGKSPGAVTEKQETGKPSGEVMKKQETANYGREVLTEESTGEQTVRLGIAVTVHKSCTPFLSTAQVIPKAVTLGMGCRKNKDPEGIEKAADICLEQGDIFPQAVERLASISIKKNEPGLLALAENKKLPFLTFEGEELMKVQGEFTPSAFVKSVTGADNVCERSAVLGAAKGKLIKRKSGGDGVTTALALREWEVHFE